MLDPRGTHSSAIQADLIDRLGRDRVRVGADAHRFCGVDVLAIVLPQSASDVEAAVQVARRRHVTLDVRYRLPCLPDEDLRDVVVVAATELTGVLEIDIARRTATVGAGVSLHALDRAARQARLSLRALPTWPGERVGALIAEGDGGEIGAGAGSLLEDVVGAQVVTGAGRTLLMGGAEFVGARPTGSRGVPTPLMLLDGHQGRAMAMCAVTLRLHRAPWHAWSGGHGAGDRATVLRVLSAGRELLSSREIDTLRVVEGPSGMTVEIRAVSHRGEADADVVSAHVATVLGAAGLQLTGFVADERKVRLGLAPAPWPHADGPMSGILLQVAWPDLPGLLDVTDAVAGRAATPVHRSWSAGPDGLRLLLPVSGAGPQPWLAQASALMDAGALPVAVGAAWRQAVRDRMPPAAKVALTALHRALDPDGLMSPGHGLP